MALNPLDLTGVMNQARQELVGASESAIKTTMYEVMSEFFADSNSWQEDIVFTPVANTTTYALTPLEGGQIIRLVGVFDAILVPVPAFMPDFGTVQLVSASTTAPTSVPWFARVYKNIQPPTTRDNYPDAPDWTLGVYRTTILDGILGQLKNQKDKSWSDVPGSLYRLRRFRAGIMNARVASKRANAYGAQEWAFPAQFVKTSQRGGVSTAWPTKAF